MDAREDFREETFGLWATMGFDYQAYQPDFYRDSHWGDKAYQVNGQSSYDMI